MCVSPKGYSFDPPSSWTPLEDTKGTESLASKPEISTSSKFLFYYQIKSRFIGSLAEVVFNFFFFNFWRNIVFLG